MLKIKQFYDTGLAHASYAVLSDGKMAVIDPGRDPEPYLSYAEEQQAQLVAVIETHPHADFVSGHLELHHISGATIYTSKLAQVSYPYESFDDGDELFIGGITLKALDTPGHSPDSISVLLLDEAGRQHAVFTGDTLFVGDVGRPDLREQEAEAETQRAYLARQLYASTREVLMLLNRDVIVYPAHGAGSLCGRNISSELSSTIGQELAGNWALQPMSEEEFVETLLADQPFVPKYFSSNVALNKKGAPAYRQSLERVPRMGAGEPLEPGILVVDSREQLKFKNRHIKGALNLMDGPKFETWLGSIVGPEEPFYILAEDVATLESLMAKAAKIGYEQNIKGVMVHSAPGDVHESFLILEHFKAAPENYTIIDVRNHNEVREGKIFSHALPIPLHQLRERTHEIPVDKPILVHCAAGYRSAAAFSILEMDVREPVVYDMGEAIKDFKIT